MGRKTKIIGSLIALALLMAPRCALAVNYVWQNGTTLWATPGNWSPSGPPNNITTDFAEFQSTASAKQPDIGATNYSVVGLSFDNTGAATYTSISGTGTLSIGGSGLTETGTATIQSAAPLRVGATQTWNIGSTGIFRPNGAFSGNYGLTKIGTGTLLLNSANTTPNMFIGGYTVNGGILQAGNSPSLGVQELRSNPVNLVSGQLNTNGSTSDLSVGQLSGSGSIATVRAVNVQASANATFSGSITGGGNGGLFVRGYGATQSFNGNLTAVNGSTGAGAYSGSTLRLTGTGDSTSGVLGTTTPLVIRGGTVTLDNTSGDTGAAAGRIGNSAAVGITGGGVSLIGDSDGTSETVGTLSLNSGSATISATNTGSGATLAFPNTNSLRNATNMVVNFVGSGGTLGTSATGPRVTFGTLFTNTTNGMLANTSSATSQTIGWAVVNGSSWAGQSSGAIVPLSDTARDQTNIASAASWELTNFAPTVTTTTLSGNLGTSATVSLGALKISPTASGQTLAVGTNTIFSPALMLAGNTDFAITGTTGGFGIGNGTRYVWVNEAGTTLDYGAALPSTGPINKAGDGIFSLSSTTATQLPTQAGSSVNTNILGGVLRSTLTALGGGTASGGATTTINLRGGVLEISGGGTLTRGINVAGSNAGGGLRFRSSATDLGDGGFSAYNGNATVTLVSGVNGTVAPKVVWDDGSFLEEGRAFLLSSTKADSRITFTNDIGLDDNNANNPYAAREFRVADNPSSTTDFAQMSGVISGSAYADLLKTGPGTLELSKSTGNTYTGVTLVNGGTLLVSNASGSGTGTGPVAVNVGGTLGGTGIITGQVTVFGGTLAPGASPGVLTISNTVTLNSASTLAYDLLGSDPTEVANNDRIVGVIDLVLDGTLTVKDVTPGAFATASVGNQWTLITYSGTLTDNGLALGVMPALAAGRDYAIDTLGTPGKVLLTIVTAVPEASSLLAVGLVAVSSAGYTFFRRRRRSSKAAV